MTNQLIFLLLASVLVNLFMMKFAKKIKLLDVPNNKSLKIHSRATPLSGGPSIFITILIGLLIFDIYKIVDFSEFESSYLLIVISAAIIFLVGLVDDFAKLSPKTRLLIFFASAVIALFKFYNEPFGLLFLIIATIFVVIEVIAINMIDGIDGLCGFYFLISLVGFYFISNNLQVKLLISIFIVGAITFLILNFPPAKIFLGDSGSTLIGFLICYIIIFNISSSYSAKEIISNLLIISWPLINFFKTIINRIKMHQPIMEGRRDHIYDKLMEKYSRKQTLAILSGTQAAIVLFAIFIDIYF